MNTLIKSILLSSALTFSISALASQSSCNLPDLYESSTYKVEDSVVIQKNSKLSALSKSQILTYAKVQAAEEDISVKTVKSAINYLIDASEGGDLMIETQVAEGTAYDVVIHYPGGNPYGMIFKKGTAKAIAVITDSDVTCLD